MSNDLSPPAALAIAFGAVDTGSMKERLAFGYLSHLGHKGDGGGGDGSSDDKDVGENVLPLGWSAGGGTVGSTGRKK